jgi:hypothetical protein
MERIHFRSTSLLDIQAELRERELLREADVRRRAPRRHPLAAIGLASLTNLGRHLLR